MPTPIAPIANVPAPESIRLPSDTAKPGEFQAVLGGAIRQVEQFGGVAARQVEEFLAGEGGELHTTILATQRAELVFDFFLQARNKVVEAYQEIMRMQM